MQGICHLSCVPIRKEPGHRSEMVSQLIYGELYEVINSDYPDWFLIRCHFDGYEGFISKAQFKEMTEMGKPAIYTGAIAMDEINNLFSKGAEIYNLETLVEVDEDELIDFSKIHLTSDQIKENIFFHSTSMINTTYLWGGRTPWGIDCSGFSQIVFKVCGIPIPRDASEQAKLGESISLEQADIGDLAFFSNPEGKIVHVGIVMGQQMIIHASGCVRVDQLNMSGIINLDTKQRTHTLHSIKRIFS